jgi:hypothetical protein
MIDVTIKTDATIETGQYVDGVNQLRVSSSPSGIFLEGLVHIEGETEEHIVFSIHMPEDAFIQLCKQTIKG